MSFDNEQFEKDFPGIPILFTPGFSSKKDAKFIYRFISPVMVEKHCIHKETLKNAIEKIKESCEEIEPNADSWAWYRALESLETELDL